MFKVSILNTSNKGGRLSAPDKGTNVLLTTCCPRTKERGHVENKGKRYSMRTNRSTQTWVTVVSQKSPSSSCPDNPACTHCLAETVRKGLVQGLPYPGPVSLHPAEEAWRRGRSACRRRVESPQGSSGATRITQVKGSQSRGRSPSSHQ